MAGLIDTGINYRKQANAAFGQVAKNAAEIANANRKLSAAEKAGKFNAAGQGLGMGYMAYESGLLGKGAQGLGAGKGVVDALTPGGDVAGAVNELTVAPNYSASALKSATDSATQLGLGQGPGAIQGPEGAKSVVDVANALDPSLASNAANAANTATNATQGASSAGTAATGGNVTSMGGTLGGAINGAASGFASGMASGGLGTGIAGGVGGGLGGAVGGTIAAPLQLAGTVANAVSAGSGAELLAAGSDIAAGAATAGAGALEGLAGLIMAF